MSQNPYSNSPTAPMSGLSSEQIKDKLKAPGIALIVVGSIGLLLMGAYMVLTVVMALSGAPGFEPPPQMTDPAERTGFYIGAYGVIIMMVLNTLFQIFIILGGLAMVKGKGRGAAFAGSILSVIPCLSSSLCFLGIPFGIWALVVLADPNVKRSFK